MLALGYKCFAVYSPTKSINLTGTSGGFERWKALWPAGYFTGGFTISNFEGNGWAGSEKTKFGLRIKGKSFASF